MQYRHMRGDLLRELAHAVRAVRSPLTGHLQAEDTGVLRVGLRMSGKALEP